MKVVLLVVEDNEIREELKIVFPEDYFIIDSTGNAYSWALLSDLSQGLVLIDTDWPEAAKWLQKASKLKPELFYIGVGRHKERAVNLSDSLYDFMIAPFDSRQLKKSFDRAWENARLLSSESKEMDGYMSSNHFGNAEQKPQLAQGYPSRPWASILSDFSRALSNQLNKDRFLDLLLKAVKELVPVGKVSVLLRDNYTGTYSISAQSGLDPKLHKQLRFKETEGIISWLSEKGRILHLSEVMGPKENIYCGELIQEMKLLHAVVCVPIMAQGRLNGVLCLGPKVAGDFFYDKELELLYTVCGNIAIALNDIDLHGQIYNQKVYIESILQLMNSGLVAIDNHHIITTYNHRAGSILSKEPDKMIGQDLRMMPSPLGDMLYETLLNGSVYHNEEINLLCNNIPLELSTYRMVDSSGEVLGSVMIFDDISARKQLESERRQAEQLEVLNSFVSQLAHEIKNPMVAIDTFYQMLPEKYDDSTFRNSFYKTVKQEVKRLNEIIDQLIAFSSPIFYQYEVVGVHELIEDALTLLYEQGQGISVQIEKEYCKQNPLLKVDRQSMVRAFSYLLKYLFEALKSEGTVYIKTLYNSGLNNSEVVKIMITDSGTTVKPKDLEKMFNPLSISRDNTISLGLPVSKKIIEEHGGRLQAGKPDEEALKFRISLPVFLKRDEIKGE